MYFIYKHTNMSRNIMNQIMINMYLKTIVMDMNYFFGNCVIFQLIMMSLVNKWDTYNLFTFPKFLKR